MIGSRAAAAASLLLLVWGGSGCFAPSFADGTIACGLAGECPDGLLCAGDGLCYREINIDDAGPTNVEVVAQSLAEVGAVAIDGTDVYWSADKGLWRRPHAGGASEHLFATPGDTPHSIAVAGGFIYYSDYGAGKVERVELATSAVTTLFSSGNQAPQALELDATHVFFATDGLTATVRRVAHAGGNSDGLTSINEPDVIEVVGAQVYWGSRTGDGKVRRMNTNGNNPVLVAALGTPTTDMISDATSIYVATPGLIYRISEDSGATPLLSGNQGQTHLAVNSQSLFWSDELEGGAVMTAPRDGSQAPVALATGLDRPAAMVANEDAVYVVAGTQLLRIALP